MSDNQEEIVHWLAQLAADTAEVQPSPMMAEKQRAHKEGMHNGQQSTGI